MIRDPSPGPGYGTIAGDGPRSTSQTAAVGRPGLLPHWPRRRGAIPFRSRRVFLSRGRSRMRGPHVSECPLNQALQSTLAILAKVRSDDLAAPTPCMSWDVRALISHFVGTARWWAAAIAGEDAAVDADYAAGDFVAAYEE